jgi:hypothetical protein
VRPLTKTVRRQAIIASSNAKMKNLLCRSLELLGSQMIVIPSITGPTSTLDNVPIEGAGRGFWIWASVGGDRIDLIIIVAAELQRRIAMQHAAPSPIGVEQFWTDSPPSRGAGSPGLRSAANTSWPP